MKVAFSEPADIDSDCEIRLGVASWDDGTNKHQACKYAWRNSKNGVVSRGGEVPVEALPQMLDFAIRNGYLRIAKK